LKKTNRYSKSDKCESDLPDPAPPAVSGNEDSETDNGKWQNKNRRKICWKPATLLGRTHRDTA